MLDDDTRFGKTIESLGCGRGVNWQERGLLVRLGHRGVFRLAAVQDPVFDLLLHCDEQRLQLVEHVHLPVVEAATAAAWFITPLMNHVTNEPSRGSGKSGECRMFSGAPRSRRRRGSRRGSRAWIAAGRDGA